LFVRVRQLDAPAEGPQIRANSHPDLQGPVPRSALPARRMRDPGRRCLDRRSGHSRVTERTRIRLGMAERAGRAIGDRAQLRHHLNRSTDAYGAASHDTVRIRLFNGAGQDLLDAIAERGTVISEYPPGTTPARHRFLVRNRLIAAMGEATVVLEAGRRSGSTATFRARTGLESGDCGGAGAGDLGPVGGMPRPDRERGSVAGDRCC